VEKPPGEGAWHREKARGWGRQGVYIQAEPEAVSGNGEVCRVDTPD